MSFPLENPQLLKPLAHADVVETPPRPASPEHRFGTRAVHSGAHIDPSTGAVIAPVSSIFRDAELMVFADHHDICRSRCLRLLRSQVSESQLVIMSTLAARIPIGKFLSSSGRDHNANMLG